MGAVLWLTNASCGGGASGTLEKGFPGSTLKTGLADGSGTGSGAGAKDWGIPKGLGAGGAVFSGVLKGLASDGCGADAKRLDGIDPSWGGWGALSEGIAAEGAASADAAKGEGEAGSADSGEGPARIGVTIFGVMVSAAGDEAATGFAVVGETGARRVSGTAMFRSRRAELSTFRKPTSVMPSMRVPRSMLGAGISCRSATMPPLN